MRDTVSGFAIKTTVTFGKPSLPPTQLSHLLFALATSAAVAAAEEAAALPAPQAVALPSQNGVFCSRNIRPAATPAIAHPVMLC